MSIEQKIKELKEGFQPMADPGDSINITWTRSDIQDRARETGSPLTDSEARQVLKALKEKHDANEGVNWNVIDCCILQIKNNWRLSL